MQLSLLLLNVNKSAASVTAMFCLCSVHLDRLSAYTCLVFTYSEIYVLQLLYFCSGTGTVRYVVDI